MRTVKLLFILLVLAPCLRLSAQRPSGESLWTSDHPFPTGVSSRQPALAMFNNTLYAAWIANDQTRALLIGARGADGIVPRARRINGADSSLDEPAMAAFGNRLCLSWRANDPSRGIYISCTSDPEATWPAGRRINAVSDVAPAMAALGRDLFIVWRADSRRMHITGSRDGEKWSVGKAINELDSTPEAPAVAAFDGRLFVAFRANDPSNSIFVTSNNKPLDDWSKGKRINDRDSTPRRPALAATRGTLYLTWTADNISHRLFYSSSSDGKKWPYGVVVNDAFASLMPPALAAGPNEACLAWLGADASRRLHLSCSTE